MKNPTPGMWVKHFDRVGVIDAVNNDGYAVVHFPVSPYPFPERWAVRVSELKRFRQKKQVDDYEPAPF